MGMYNGLVIEDVGFRRGVRTRVAQFNLLPSLTKQEFVEECDINNLMVRYQKTGLLTHVNRYQGEYSDVTGAVDYHEAQQIVLAASNAFMSLPSAMRARFDNDPGKFLDFVSNPANAEVMYELGLAVKKEIVNGDRPVREEVSSTSGAVEKPRGSDDGKSSKVSP